nr:uncharacterized protein LOC105333286 [Crassostrea gigas]
MDSRQAQVLSSLVYNIEKTVSLGHRMYMFDIGRSSKGHMCISASNNSYSDSYPSREHESDIFFTSPSGLYIALGEKGIRRELICVYGTHNSVKQQQAKLLQSPYTRGDTPQRNRKVRLQLGESRILWGEDEDPLHRGCGSKFGFTPQGIAFTKSGGILICLWNNEFGERSSGKVISIDGKLQIFIDKNRPLYVCPTYIVENGNGDICVSDVRAVVVTDAGGLLRFRYQGNSSSNNFYPYGICCDSSCNIIVADMNNDKIHVVDKDGEFLYHVTYDGIKMPRALCIDGNDRMYVGEWDSDAIKVIAR